MMGNCLWRWTILLLPHVQHAMRTPSIDSTSSGDSLARAAQQKFTRDHNNPHLSAHSNRLGHHRDIPDLNVSLDTQNDEEPVNFDGGPAIKRTRIDLPQDVPRRTSSQLNPSVESSPLPAKSFPALTGTSSQNVAHFMQTPTGNSMVPVATSSANPRPPDIRSTFPMSIPVSPTTERHFQLSGGNSYIVNDGENPIPLGAEDLPRYANSSMNKTKKRATKTSTAQKALRTQNRNVDLASKKALNLSPVFRLRQRKINYQMIEWRPLNIDGQLVLQGLNRLKFADGTKFYNLPGDATTSNQSTFSQKLFRLSATPRNCMLFFNHFSSLLHDHTASKGDKSKPDRNRDSITPSNHQEIWKKLLQYGERPNGAVSRLKEYSNRVLPDFTQAMTKLKAKNLFKATLNGIALSSIFSYRIFPIYLFYVDLINAILEDEVMEELDNLFQTERRQSAATLFFHFLDPVNFRKLTSLNQPEISDEELGESQVTIDDLKKLCYANNGMAFIWKVIDFWLQNSRKKETLKVGKPVSYAMKVFFNTLFDACFKDAT